MIYHTESKVQCWRALAVYADGSEGLLCLGRSTTQVRAGYADAFREVLDDEERTRVRGVHLECWQGAPDQGRWVFKSALAVPDAAKAVLSA